MKESTKLGNGMRAMGPKPEGRFGSRRADRIGGEESFGPSSGPSMLSDRCRRCSGRSPRRTMNGRFPRRLSLGRKT